MVRAGALSDAITDEEAGIALSFLRLVKESYMAYETITYEKEEGFAILTLNRPNQRNAISPQLAAEVEDALDQAAADEEVKVLIVTGGTETFSAGMDLKAGRGGGGRREPSIFSIVEGLAAFEKPTIAAVSGYALGGGCELAMACDLRVASNTVTFGFPEVNMGFMPGAGGTQRLPRLVGIANAKEKLFSGDRFDAQEAYRIGLVNKVVPVESLMEETKKMAQALAGKSPLSLKTIKKCVDDGMQMDLASGLQYAKIASLVLTAARAAAAAEQKPQ